MGDKRVRKGKLFRRKMWAAMTGSVMLCIEDTEIEAVLKSESCDRVSIMPVMVTEIRKAGAKRGRG